MDHPQGGGSFTTSKKLARLNGIVGMVEHETDAQGNAKIRAWEWKAAK